MPRGRVLQDSRPPRPAAGRGTLEAMTRLRWHHALGAGLGAGVLLGLVDLQRLAAGAPDHPGADALRAASWELCWTAVLGAAAGLAAWGLVGLLTTAGRAPVLRRLPPAGMQALAAGILVWPLCAALGARMLAGPGISRWEHVALLRAAAPWVLAGAVALGALVLGRAARPGASRTQGLLLAAVLLAAGWAGDRLNGVLLLGRYGYLHDVAAGLTLVLVLAGLLLGLRWTGGRARGAAVFLALLLPLAASGAVILQRGGPERLLLATTTLHGRRIAAVQRLLLGRSGPGSVQAAGAEAVIEALAASRSQADAYRRTLDAALPGRRGFSLLWIMVDTLRADHLGCYGYSRPTSPYIDRFARRASLFRHVWAQFPITSYSAQSLFYGRYPTATPLYRRMRGLPDLESGNVTLPELLTERGFRTACIPGIASALYDHPEYEVLVRGFQELDPGRDGEADRDARAQAERALEFLEGAGGERFFLFVHLFDPHAPYVPHAEHRFGSSSLDLYDGEVAYADRQVGRVLEGLRAAGLEDRTVVVLGSDHGEAFGEHRGIRFHGSTLYEEQLRVPLLVRVPGVPARRIGTVAENVDLMPTVLDLLGVDHELPLQGISLARLIVQGPDSAGPEVPLAYAELPEVIGAMSPSAANKKAVLLGREKLIHDVEEGYSELYDLREDPGETRPLAARRPARAARLLAVLRHLEASCRRVNTPAPEERAPPWAGRRRELQALPPMQRSQAWVGILAEGRRSLQPLVRGTLQDPGEHPWVKGTILALGGELPGPDGEPAALELLGADHPTGTRHAALAFLEERCSRAYGPVHRESLEEALGRPSLALPAAEALARLGSGVGRPILEAVLEESRHDATRWRAACGLGWLGEARAAPVLRESLGLLLHRPAQAARTLKVLARLEDREALSRVVGMVEQPYVHHRILGEALAYLETVEADLAVDAYLGLLVGWDPGVVQAAREAVERRLGQARMRVLVQAAAKLQEALALLERGQHAAALDPLDAVLAVCGPGRAGVRQRLRGARAGRLAGQEGRALEAARRVAATEGAPRAYRLAARRLEQALAAGNTGALPELELRRLRAMDGAPPSPGESRTHAVEVVHAKGGWCPGGSWPDALKVRLAWVGDGAPAPGTGASGRLPLEGLVPGESCQVVLRGPTPVAPGTYRVRVETLLLRDGEHQPVGEPAALTSRVPGEGGAGLDPRGLVLRGARLLRLAHQSPGLVATAVLEDGSVVFAPGVPDPRITAPLLASHERPLEVRVVLTVPGDPGSRELAQLFYAAGPEDPFGGSDVAEALLPADGSRQELRVVLPPRKGRGVRRLRLDPVQEPRGVILHAVELRLL